VARISGNYVTRMVPQSHTQIANRQLHLGYVHSNSPLKRKAIAGKLRGILWPVRLALKVTWAAARNLFTQGLARVETEMPQ